MPWAYELPVTAVRVTAGPASGLRPACTGTGHGAAGTMGDGHPGGPSS